jgi:hypothetical protein
MLPQMEAKSQRISTNFTVGTGVPPVSHAQDARATFRQYHHPHPKVSRPISFDNPTVRHGTKAEISLDSLT